MERYVLPPPFNTPGIGAWKIFELQNISRVLNPQEETVEATRKEPLCVVRSTLSRVFQVVPGVQIAPAPSD